MKSRGEFIAQLCHIEAAEPGGERFNPKMTNEERRSVENLLLLCYDHHITTNNVAEYSVARLKKMKADHEALYADPTEKILASFIDVTEGLPLRPPSTLDYLNQVMNWNESPEELKQTLKKYFEPLCEDLKKIPRRAKEILAIILRRGKAISGSYGIRDFYSVLYFDLREALETSDRELSEQIRVLEHHKFAYFVEDDEGNPTVETKRFDWELWKTIVDFCQETNIDIERIVVYGDITLFDAPKS